jgi:hypothetical protein
MERHSDCPIFRPDDVDLERSPVIAGVVSIAIFADAAAALRA